MKKLIMCIACITFCCLSSAFCQNSAKTETISSLKRYEIILNDGSSLVGIILSRDSAAVHFHTTSIAKIDIPVSQIKSLKEFNSEKIPKTNDWVPNPFPTKYFFSASAINLHKNEGYYQNTYLFMNSVNYGFTDYFSIGAGLEVLSTFGSLTSGDKFTPICYIAPKVGFKVTEKIHLGAGLTFINVGDFFGNSGIGLASGLATYGSIENNVTLGIGSGFSFKNEYMSNVSFSLSGMTRVSKRLALVTENYLIPVDDHYYGMYSYGMRFIANKISVDLGFINNKDIVKVIFIGIPYVDFSVKF
jgi:hypothetical protein